MNINKKIAKALVNKTFSEAKELVYKSLYAKASLALDEARYEIASSVFNSPVAETEEETEEVTEDTEQLDELSPELLGRYTRKASTQVGFHGDEKREKGITKAKKKISSKSSSSYKGYS